MIVPAVGSSSPATIRSVVVLPQPDGPEQREEPALLDHQVEVVDRGEAAEPLGDADVSVRSAPAACVASRACRRSVVTSTIAQAPITAANCCW